jgi:rSAM/selenodomain-associated transferase 1
MLEPGGNMSDTALVIMARYPELGKTKTRLAASIGAEETLHLYRAFLIDLAQRFADWNCDLYWAYTPANVEFAEFLRGLVSLDISLWRNFPQHGTGLGDRLLHAFCTTHADHMCKTIVIASDSPHISHALISQAQEALDSADVVLGPAEDGGYYLIAMRKPHDVFSGIPMSTQHVLQMTVDKAHQLGLSVHLLEPLFDIDELPDLFRLAHILQEEQALAPATAACLAKIMSTQFMEKFV